MKISQILIISASIEHSPLAFPMGAMSIYTAIRTDDDLVSTYDASLRHFYGDTDDPARSAQEDALNSPDILAISLYLFNREWMYHYLNVFRDLCPDTMIIAGGPDVISSPAELIARGVQYLIIGEGETTVRRFLKDLRDGKEPQGAGIYSEKRPLLVPAYEADLESLHSPLLFLSDSLPAYPGVLWEMTRGCPFRCSFCAESRGNRRVRSYPFERLEKELQAIISIEVTSVFILDPTFNLEKERTHRILSFLKEHSPEDIHYTFEVRGELLDESTVEQFSGLTCSLQIGLQSSNEEVMKQVDRAFAPDRFHRGVSLLHRHGIVFGLDLIIALPGDTLDSFKESVEYAVHLRPSNLDIFTLSLLPGTEIYDRRDTFALQYEIDSPYEVKETTTMSASEIETAQAIRRGCDIFYTKGEAVMWFIRVVEVLGMTAADFFLECDEYMKVTDFKAQDDTFVLQEEFINKMYRDTDKEEYLPLILSYVELHQGLCYLRDTLDTPVVHLSYTIDVLNRLDEESARVVLSDESVVPYEHDLLLYTMGSRVMVEEV
ncbi:MAG: radical SAM protein [Sphaerochaetaceae bacterium]|nr:radical SAM protein [Sphaerochaetaceae bacterium]